MTSTEIANASKIMIGSTEAVKMYIGSTLMWLDAANGHAYIEIGGIKWATMNVGASSETDSGLFFQWGDTLGYTTSQVGSGSGKKYFGYDDYKYKDPNDSNNSYSKYNFADNKNRLDLSDDSVNANWGGSWRMPTSEEIEYLIDCTYLTFVDSYNGITRKGVLFTDKNDSSKKLFFPSYSYAKNGSAGTNSSYSTYIPSCDLCVWYEDYFECFNAYTNNNVGDNFGLTTIQKWQGYTVRGVLDTSGQPQNSYEFVDLGLPSGTLWSTKNVGSQYVTGAGYFVQWANTSRINQDPYTVGTSLNSICADDRYDIARYICGNLKIPRQDHVLELIDNCSITTLRLHGVNCFKITSNINGNTIYIPAISYSSGRVSISHIRASDSDTNDTSKSNTLLIVTGDWNDYVSSYSISSLNKSIYKYVMYRGIRILPAGYTELEYISSTNNGNQYIDLGIKLYDTLNKNYDIAIKFTISSTNALKLATIFNCQDPNNNPWPGTFIRKADSGTNVVGRYIGGTNKDNTIGQLDLIIELPVLTPPNKNVTNLNNNNSTHQYGAGLFCSFSNTSNAPQRYCNGRLYYFKLFVEGALIRDLIPCKNSNNVVGMYDVVNDVFYTSPNGNAFVAGPVV